MSEAKFTVFVADDDAGQLDLATDLLQSVGHGVLAEQDATRVFARIVEEQPDLVLLDVMMPKKSGFEVCQALRADAATAQIKVVMLTAKGRESEVAKGMALGADLYVTKPFSTKDLVARVKSMLGA